MTGPSCENQSGCITCGDEGIPMRVLELREGEAVCVDDHGATHQVALDLLGAVLEGDRVLVHAGVAIGAVA
jgi:hydrogenase assembly chaperone HypC/HupF